MDPQQALQRAADSFAAVLAQVGDDQWALPTPNDGQDVRALVDHVIGGDRMAAAILAGGSREDGLAQFARSADDTDRVAAFAEASAALGAAFAEPGAMERTVAHPAMPMPGAMLHGFRLTEYTLHGWDLARAIGADDSLDPETAEAVWAVLEPLAPMMAASGMFGTGPSGTVAADAPIQERVLDLAGRRP